MNAVLLNTGVVVFIIYAAFSIVYQVNAYRTATALRQFITLSSKDMLGVLAELRATLENFKKISSNVAIVTDNVREITSSITDLKHDVSTLYGFIKKTAGAEARADLAGLKAGIRTGVATLVKSHQEERSEEHERRT